MIRILRRSAGLLRTKGLISDQYWRNQCAAIQTLANGSSSHTETNANGWTWAVLGALAGLIGSTTTVAHLSSDDPLHPSQDQGFHLLGIENRRRQFFKYEKRIRELSPPEKVFEYFATQGSLQHGFSMTSGDMMRSVVPVYPPSGSDVVRAGSLPGEPAPEIPNNSPNTKSFLKVFDVDNSGLITFDEWLVFQALLAIPDDDVQVAFKLVDTDSSGKIDRAEFKTLLASIQARASKQPTATLRKSIGNLNEADMGLVKLFFGADGKGQVSLERFRDFLREMRNELVKLEFQFYDYDNSGWMNGIDFAHSIACSARLKHVDEYLDKIDKMPENLAKQRIDYNQFLQFRMVWRRLRQLAVALEFWKSHSGKVMPDDFATIAQRILDVDLPRGLLDILYHLFSTADGSLNVNFMFSVMDRHFETGLAVNYEHMKQEEKSFFTCMQKCAALKNK